MRTPIPSTRDKTTQYINRISLSSLAIISGYFIITSHLTVSSFKPEIASQILLRNILFTLVFIAVFSLVLNQLLSKVVGLVREKENAENKAAIKAQFLSTMSHEIRTPMNAVVGLSNILLHERPREDQVDNLKTLKFSADLLLSLINDILDYSKIEAGKITMEKVDFELADVVNNIKNALNPRAEHKQIGLNVNVGSNIPQQVCGDQVRLSQILTNLIGNAIKFTDQGAVDINLKLINQNANGTSIRFEVKDTGIGISEDKFEQIFKSFSQAEANTTRKFGGTGLGLSITKRLLELQGSEIKLKSKLGHGSTFYFDLVFETVIQKKASVQKSVDNDFTTFNRFNLENILLVEDNKINIMVAKKFLSKWNLDIDVAENGAIALDKLQNKDYCLILMDLNMPVMDGYTATEKIRNLDDPKFQNIPIIALSASAIDGFRTKAFDAGMNAFVTKPFNPEELYQVLSEFIKESVQTEVV